MAYSFADGSKFFLGTTFGPAVNVTAVSNSTPAVLTATNTFTAGDELLFISGWDDLTENVYKPSAFTGSSITLGGSVPIDTSDTNWYPPGTGTGTVQKVTAWTEIPQVLSISTSGGDPKFVNIEPLARRNAIQVPVGFNASSLQIDLGYDPTLSGYQALAAAARGLKKQAFKFVLAGGQTGYGYGYVALSEMPKLQKGQANTVTASISMLGRIVGYQN